MQNRNIYIKDGYSKFQRKLTYYGLKYPVKRIKKDGENKMATLREMSSAYEAPKTKNIADLKEVSTELDIKTDVFKQGTPEEFSVNFVEIHDEKYRVPNSVLKQLKVLLAEKRDMTKFKVTKTGEGLNTEYQVIPLD